MKTLLATIGCSLLLSACGEEGAATPGPSARGAPAPLPRPELCVLWVHGLEPAILGASAEPAPELPELAAASRCGSRMERLYSLASDSQVAAACLWNGVWPHEGLPAPADPSASALGAQLESLGYRLEDPRQLAGPGSERSASARFGAWLAPASAPGAERRALLLETDLGLPRGREETSAILSALEGTPREPGVARLFVLVGSGRGGEPVRELSLRAPCWLCWPGVVPERTSRPQLANLLDLRATILELVGAEPAPEGQGQSFARLLRRERQVWRAYVCAEGDSEGRWWPWLRTAEWSYSRSEGGRAHLYSLVSDPGESIDMAGRSEVAAQEHQLGQMLETWMREVHFTR